MKKVQYTPEIRERAVQLVIESEKDYPSNWATVSAIAPWAVLMCAEIVGHFHLGYSKQPTNKSPLPFDLVS